MFVGFFLRVSTDAYTVSEPIGVGVVASSALVQACDTLNTHCIASTEKQPSNRTQVLIK